MFFIGDPLGATSSGGHPGFIRAATGQGFSKVFFLHSGHSHFSLEALRPIQNMLIVCPCPRELLETLKPSDGGHTPVKHSQLPTRLHFPSAWWEHIVPKFKKSKNKK